MLEQPAENEYPEYYRPYINLVPKGNLVQLLKENLNEVVNLFGGISEEKTYYRYAPGKWSVKELLGHITDTERIMCYRLLRVGRGDQTPLAGFDENDYVQAAQTNNLSMEAIIEDFKAARNATITLIQNLPAEAWANKGNANGIRNHHKSHRLYHRWPPNPPLQNRRR